MVNLQRQRKKTEEKHELEEEIGGSENVRIPNYLVKGKAPPLWASPEANQCSSPPSLFINGGESERSSCSPELVEFVSFVGELDSAVKSAGELARAVKSAGELVSVVGFDRRRIQNQSGELSDLELGGK